MRAFVETIIGLSIAVSLVRGLATEGYMISTGSMAPTLLGYHRDATCPHCRYEFARGSVPASARSRHADTSTTTDSHAEHTCCPNCGEKFTVASPRVEGDQLLVHKHAYASRSPRRWEVVVFRNPTDPAEAYIKRIAGLPGESIRVRHGDVFAGDRLCRKDFATQQAMRLPVADANHEATVPSRWQLDERWFRTRTADDQTVFDHEGATSSIRYEHRTRSGGRHRTSVAIATWPGDHPPDAARLVYDEGLLHCVGVMPPDVERRLLTLSDEPGFQRAIVSLATASQTGFITDDCGYNQPGQPDHPVRDLMWSGRLLLDTTARLDVRLLYGRQPFVLSITHGRLALSTLDASGQPLLLRDHDRRPADDAIRWHEIAFSLFDRQLTVAIDGQPVWEPQPFGPTELAERPSRTPLTITGTGRLRLDRVALWRDVYVTPPDNPGQAIELSAESFFVLGDNSPVSVDSRRWDAPEVPRSSLIGKPLVVHLPSRQRYVPLAGWLRVPDLDRMRLVR